MKKDNLFKNIPTDFENEIFETLARTPEVKIERILSCGQATPSGEWLDQDWHEWVILLKGCAGLRFDGESNVVELNPGDFVTIPARLSAHADGVDRQPANYCLAGHSL